MRLFGNWGSIRVGAFAVMTPVADWYWNRQWAVTFQSANGTLTKTVDLTDEDLAAFYVKAKSESGSLILSVSQEDTTKEIDISGTCDETVDLSGLRAGSVKLLLTAKSVKNMKALIGWRR